MAFKWIDGLDGDAIRITAGVRTFIDVGRDAAFGGTDASVLSVNYAVRGQSHNPHGIIALAENGGIDVSDTNEVSVDGTVIGSIVHAEGFNFQLVFNAPGSQGIVDRLLQALTINLTMDDGNLYEEGAVTVWVDGSISPHESATIQVRAAKAEPVILLTKGIDTIEGTANDDVFVAENITPGDRISGGAGEDMLYLMGGSYNLLDAEVSGIERIQASSYARETISINADQLVDLLSIDAGPSPNTSNDTLIIGGTRIDLRNLEVDGFDTIRVRNRNAVIITDDINDAMAMVAGSTRATLQLTKGLFTTAQRELLHNQGFDTIIDGAQTTIFQPLQLGGLSDETLRAAPGRTTYLDVGRNAVLASSTKPLDYMSFEIYMATAGENLGIDTTGAIELSDGLNVGSAVTVDNVAIGTIETAYNDTTSQYYQVRFSAEATAARVEQLIRSITYTMRPDAANLAERYAIVLVADKTGRTSSDDVTIVHDTPTAPETLSLSGTATSELAMAGTMIGSLSSKDINVADSVRYVLAEDAGGRFRLDGAKLVVADGTKLDYEQAATHSVTIRAIDGAGLSREQQFTINVGDVARETIVGTAGNDVFFGGAARDTIAGAAGRDMIGGGLAADNLRGGASRDIFVFDTKLSRQNIDTIRDFNPRDDSIHLDRAIFTKIGKGVLKSETFFLSGTAHDPSDRILYNAKTGALLYDADGTGAAAAVQFAKIGKGLAVTERDFFGV